jgi:hypothetical protein
MAPKALQSAILAKTNTLTTLQSYVDPCCTKDIDALIALFVDGGTIAVPPVKPIEGTNHDL